MNKSRKTKKATKTADAKTATGLAAAKPKAKTGRPAGTPNQEPATAKADPPRCQACGATDLRSLRIISTTNHHGERNGQRYTTITRRRMQCQHCGRVHAVAEYRYDPQLWSGE